MRMFNQLPLRIKLIFLMFLSNFLLVLFMCTFLLYWDLTTIKRNTIEISKSEIATLNQQFAKIILLDSATYAADVISNLRDMARVKKLLLFDRDGKAKLRFARDGELNLSVPESLPVEPEFKTEGMYISANIVYDDTNYGSIYALVSTDLLNEKIHNSTVAIIILFFVALVISVVISYAFQQFFSKPILHLAKLLNRVTQERNFDISAESAEHNEIGVLYENFNEMIRELRLYHGELKDKNLELENHRSRLENLVQLRTHKLKRYTDELESFSYSVSHDLRSPLRAINGYCNLLIDDYKDRLDQSALEYLERISAATCRMGNLIDDLLTLSRITRFELKPKFIDFTNLCKSIVASDIYAENFSHVQVNIQSEMKLYGDEKLIRIMMENLINNAAKYSQYQIQPCVSIKLNENTENTIIAITDNGVGFDSKYAENLFKPFQRLHESSKFEGTGIGLTIVQRIAQRHSGKVWAKSQENAGSTFFTAIPKRNSKPLAVKQDKSVSLVQ